MREVLTLSVLSACIGVLVPEGGRRILKALAALLLMRAMVEPLADACQRIAALPEQIQTSMASARTEGEEAQTETEEWIIRRTVRTVEAGVTALMVSRWSVDAEQVRVQVHTSPGPDGAVVIEEILLHVPKGLPAEEIERYLDTIGLSPCRVVFGEEEGHVE